LILKNEVSLEDGDLVTKAGLPVDDILEKYNVATPSVDKNTPPVKESGVVTKHSVKELLKQQVKNEIAGKRESIATKSS
jgi:hypothetical protein